MKVIIITGENMNMWHTAIRQQNFIVGLLMRSVDRIRVIVAIEKTIPNANTHPLLIQNQCISRQLNIKLGVHAVIYSSMSLIFEV